MEIIGTATTIKVPSWVSVCPICGGEVIIEDIDEWVESDFVYRGRKMWEVSETGIRVTCETEPDIDEDGWEDWFNGHWSMPYSDWLPVQIKVYKYIMSNYRFDPNADLPVGVTKENYRTFWVKS